MKDFDDYQWAATPTATYPDGQELQYLALGLTSEAGEVADKLKKLIRDNETQLERLTEQKQGIIAELGDVLWYTAMLAYELDYFSTVASDNIDKLESRQKRGVSAGQVTTDDRAVVLRPGEQRLTRYNRPHSLHRDPGSR